MTALHAPDRSDHHAPYSAESEEAVLGGILIDPGAVWDVIGAVRPDDFFIVRNQWVYEALLTLVRDGTPIDYLTVIEQLRTQNRLEEIGGAAYITYLINNTPSSLYTAAHATIVARASIRRRLLGAASEIAQLAHDGTRDTPAILNAAGQIIFDIADAGSRADAERIGPLVSADMSRVEARRAAPTTMAGLASGFADLDRLLGGMAGGELIILAGRPGMGKTAQAVTMLLHQARAGHPVALFSMEMSKPQITQRLLAQVSGVSVQRLEQGDLSEDEWAAYVAGAADLSDLPIFVDDTPDLAPMTLRAKARRLVHQSGIAAIYVDYLQLMSTGDDRRNRTRNDEVAAISRQLKIMARELDVPVIALAQLSRGVESRQDKRPTLADLRDSGAIEQDADVVIFLYREDYYNDNTLKPNQIENIIAKHRNGPTGMVPLYFRKELTQVANLRRADDDIDLSDY